MSLRKTRHPAFNPCFQNSYMHQSRRSNLGQGLASAAVGLLLFSGLFVGCLLLYLNTVVANDYNRKLSIASTAAAEVIDQQLYWLGAIRPGTNTSTIESNGRLVADYVLQSFGLPPSDGYQVSYPSHNGNTNVGTIRATQVTCTVSRLQIIGGLCLPSFVPMSGTGMSYGGAAPYAFMTISKYDLLNCPVDPKTGHSLGKQAVVPCFAVAATSGSSTDLIPLGQMQTPTRWASLNVITDYPYALTTDDVIKNYVTGREPRTPWR